MVGFDYVEFLFPAIEKQRKEELDRSGKDAADFMKDAEENNSENQHSTKYLDLESDNLHLANELLPGSEILTKGAAKLVTSV